MATITWTKKAAKQLGRLAATDRATVASGVGDLADWPNCRNVKALTDRTDFRLRVGRWRVLFTVDTSGNPVVIRIEEVKKRDDRTYN
ncbi:MAG: type II toxin-antitoxin system RelE/ParE family toxin [Desulfovibrionaceae bacterium]|nr:type II toxin-antitoxin system RelE/ParE family toxin [Desulfovibrionaceae bacterium]